MSTPNLFATSGIALVLPGEAMWGAFQTGFAVELGARLRDAGQGDQPFALTVGSSSGSLVATLAAAGAPFDHKFTRQAWLNFGLATRSRLQGDRDLKINPYPMALQGVFDQGLVDTERAYHSRTHLIVTAAHLELGASLFTSRYFTTKPHVATDTLFQGAWSVVDSPGYLRRAVEASSRIPFIYGSPILDGASLFIDGVFANNAPVELALELGARHVFIITSSQKGLGFDRPVQSLIRRQLRSVLKGSRLQNLVSSSGPLDLDDLRRRYPDRTIHVVHPKDPPPVNRFFESRPEVLGHLYDMGREAADAISLSNPSIL